MTLRLARSPAGEVFAPDHGLALRRWTDIDNMRFKHDFRLDRTLAALLIAMLPWPHASAQDLRLGLPAQEIDRPGVRTAPVHWLDPRQLASVSPETDAETLAYRFGSMISEDAVDQGIQFDPVTMLSGLFTTAHGEPLLLRDFPWRLRQRRMYKSARPGHPPERSELPERFDLGVVPQIEGNKALYGYILGYKAAQKYELYRIKPHWEMIAAGVFQARGHHPYPGPLGAQLEATEQLQTHINAVLNQRCDEVRAEGAAWIAQWDQADAVALQPHGLVRVHQQGDGELADADDAVQFEYELRRIGVGETERINAADRQAQLPVPFLGEELAAFAQTFPVGTRATIVVQPPRHITPVCENAAACATQVYELTHQTVIPYPEFYEDAVERGDAGAPETEEVDP